MERITILREQASVLRLLAGSFDIPAMRDQLLDIAARCEALARTIEQSLRQAEADVHASSTMIPNDCKTAESTKT
jgi:hypothetical protein